MTYNDNGRGRVSALPHRKLAIVGSHPATRENAPYDDPDYEIWLFNESPQKPEIYRRWDASFQMHLPEVYSSLENWVNKDHWAWLQQDHGDKRIFMMEVDPRVPNSVRYPIEEVLTLVPYKYMRSTPAQALALAILLGYQDISIYGSELASNTEYHYQAVNFAFWIGFAHGRGVNLDLQCWQAEFNQPLYGYEGELQLDKAYFESRHALLSRAYTDAKRTVDKLESKIDQLMLDKKFVRVAEISLNLESASTTMGKTMGARDEAERYMKRTNPISRQEFERVSAQAQLDGDKARGDMLHAGGKCEYVWNVWAQTGQLAALNQLRQFLQEKNQLAVEAGKQEGIFRENIEFMDEYDTRVLAAGGQRAVHHVMAGVQQ